MTPGQFAQQLFTQMIWIDYAISSLVAICLLIGLLRGAGAEMLSLFNWSLASAIGWFFAGDFTRLIASSIADPNAQIAAAFVIMFLITLMISGLVCFLIAYEKKKSRISLASHIAGFPVGFLRGLILVNLGVIIAGLTPLPNQNWWHESRMIPPFQISTTWFMHHFPSGLSGYLHYR
ncbi:CvpA family protein [Methylomicrobium sp. Wu6]|uniref:CvpA family protein n=1 Tax=Methylomicrobium sp. Wu6 TaxID=3107928 RepID=UPI002DD68AED|nr:CvpA family protein [Methylomicrobium sp. Wu6]MEC4748320.1 CvpA family protein [Methylomicrobium sp. Wu6]